MTGKTIFEVKRLSTDAPEVTVQLDYDELEYMFYAIRNIDPDYYNEDIVNKIGRLFDYDS